VARPAARAARREPDNAGVPGQAPGQARALFLIARTGGGHEAAAAAVAEALRHAYTGRFAPVVCDPLGGPGSPRLLRWVTGGYGPLIRYAPWLWGLLYRATDSAPAARLLHRAVQALAGRAVSEAVRACQPAVIVSFHPLTGQLAVRAQQAAAPAASVVTVVTDLGRPHATWRWPKADRTVAGCVPVAAAFRGEPPAPGERAALRARLGYGGAAFLIVLTGGAEGAGRIARQARAILRAVPDAGVAVICGRNRLLRRRLARLAHRHGGRLSVHGFVTNMADWLRAADLAVTKAGPGTLTEAACCGTPVLLMSRLPGQESATVVMMAAAGAGRYLPRTRRLAAEVRRLRHDPRALREMREATARLGRPAAAGQAAAVITGLAGSHHG
jgi:1,2-diacylglycerol 3-beta-galactosyltransferase